MIGGKIRHSTTAEHTDRTVVPGAPNAFICQDIRRLPAPDRP